MHHIGPHSGSLCTITARIARYNVAYLPLEPSGYATLLLEQKKLERRSGN